MAEEKPQGAFILRIAPGNRDCVGEALQAKDLIMGWDCGPNLVALADWDKFRKRVHDVQFEHDDSYRRSSRAAGSLWRFLIDMHEGDLVAVPHGPEFYVTKVTGPARYFELGGKDDTVYRRKMEALNSGHPILRGWAKAALQARLKARQTCAYAGDLVDQILDVVEMAKKPKAPSFAEDLRSKLVQQTLHEIRRGRMNPDSFEELVKGLVLASGAEEAWIVPKRLDKGGDVIARFRIAGFLETLVVQAKHYEPEPPVGPNVVDQLVNGMDAQDADLGWIVTSGTFSREAIERADGLQEERGIKIQLIEGDQLAAMVVETGVQWSSRSSVG